MKLKIVAFAITLLSYGSLVSESLKAEWTSDQNEEAQRFCGVVPQEGTLGQLCSERTEAEDSNEWFKQAIQAYKEKDPSGGEIFEAFYTTGKPTEKKPPFISPKAYNSAVKAP